MFEDDGAGLLPEQLKAAAVRKQIVTAEEAAGDGHPRRRWR